MTEKKENKPRLKRSRQTKKETLKETVVSAQDVSSSDISDEGISLSQNFDLLPFTLGVLLQKARQARHLKLSSIAKKLCIKETYLEALEKGNYQVFPALVYGIGFLRTYSNFLGLDANEMVSLFHEETTNIKDETLDTPRTQNPNIIPSKKIIFKSLFVLFILYIVWNVFQALTTKPFPQIQIPEEVTIESNVDSTPTLPVVADEIALPASSEEQKEKVEETTVSKVVSTPKREVKTYGLKKADRVSFVANAQTVIEIKDVETDSILLKKTLETGDKYNPDSESEGLILNTTNAGALDVYVDGKKLKTLGKNGQAKAGIRMDTPSLLKD